ncbi:protein FAM47E isoform X2 [Hemibagrus wyckioides]|uniref:protein FAM47E isoform X2 n=1 Tax=Hemibagrus wyckioides TaxID=337641 RepID=UPI00266BA1A8|nr:protein FAM47E isoform X2 [Hemibagrus wyckioides]
MLTAEKMHKMNDKKCQIGPGDSTPVHPWYKERLRTKCMKDPVQKLQLSGALNGRRWRFLTSGLDDFRDGYPVPQAGTFTQPQRGTEAAIFGLSHKPEPVKSPKRRFTKEQACFSKQNCLRQSRHRFVDAVEQSLSTHPLALYPHLGSGMPPELFYDVLSVLDPALHVRIETPLAKREECSKEDMVPCEGLIQETLPDPTTESPNSPVFGQDEVKKTSWNPYKLKEVKERFAKEDRMISNKSLHSTSMDEEINRVTKLFCDWVTSLGEDTSDITESTILNLFASGCEKKPGLAFQDVGTNEKPEEMPKDDSHNQELKDSELNKVYTPSKKTTYGAWYLNPKTWKKRPANEPLRDPSVTEDCEFDQQLTEKDEELKQMHGAQAFKQFIISKGLRVPGVKINNHFLSSLFLEEERENRNRVTHVTASASTPAVSAML